MTELNTLHFTGSDWYLSMKDLTPELALALADCGTPGQSADNAVAFVLANFTVTGEPNTCRAYLKAYIKGYGAWNDAELADHKANLERLVWLTGCDLRETGEAYFSTY